jgi:hypothetical protein
MIHSRSAFSMRRERCRRRRTETSCWWSAEAIAGAPTTRFGGPAKAAHFPCRITPNPVLRRTGEPAKRAFCGNGGTVILARLSRKTRHEIGDARPSPS